MHLMYFTEQPMSAYDEHAAEDTVVPAAVANQYVELLGDAELIEIAGGHNLESDAPINLAGLIIP